MSKKMEISDQVHIDRMVYAEVEIGANNVCDFITDFADDEDLDKIEAALMKRKDTGAPQTLLEEQELQVAKALARQYSLKELNEMYKKAVAV